MQGVRHNATPSAEQELALLCSCDSSRSPVSTSLLQPRLCRAPDKTLHCWLRRGSFLSCSSQSSRSHVKTGLLQAGLGRHQARCCAQTTQELASVWRQSPQQVLCPLQAGMCRVTGKAWHTRLAVGRGGLCRPLQQRLQRLRRMLRQCRQHWNRSRKPWLGPLWSCSAMSTT